MVCLDNYHVFKYLFILSCCTDAESIKNIFNIYKEAISINGYVNINIKVNGTKQ